MAHSSAIYPSLRDKKVLITGGAEGIGAAAVELFCRQGSEVIFLDISEASSKNLIESIKELSEADRDSRTTVPNWQQCDVTNLEELKEVAKRVLDNFGTIDVLVNNAAAAGAKSRVPSVQVTPESWDFDINKQGSGSIINMGSISWRIPAVGTPVYMACKAAIMGLTKTHSKEFGKDGIRVNSVMPGAIATERQIKEVLTPEYRELVIYSQTIKRDLMPKEVASVILFLASEDSSAVTGSSYVVDGGWVSDV
ncbi:hypothetical protein LTR37_015108 [Vermiconidia calcicola]|uniref:Uncharacterized protein n=1 Tax=Vermiconidia calcicola TaxID=1690605 RepID=A0ACC3MS08_9PEZI|nr:hypothetical protein LTR37_015108 [Vermiconidia calcicola]